MNCAEIAAEYEAYALGIADDPERLEIAQHLARNCPECTRGVREASALVAAMSGVVAAVNPPKNLRRRVAGLVAPPKAAWRPREYLGWAAAFAFAVAFAFLAVENGERPAGSPEMARALSIMGDPAAKDVAFTQPAARGRAFVSPGNGVVFMAAGLPALEPRRTFELWFIPASGKPVPAGTFRSEGNAALYVRPGPPAAGTAALAVTVEPEGGSPQPTTTPFLVAKL